MPKSYAWRQSDSWIYSAVRAAAVAAAALLPASAASRARAPIGPGNDGIIVRIGSTGPVRP